MADDKTLTDHILHLLAIRTPTNADAIDAVLRELSEQEERIATLRAEIRRLRSNKAVGP